LANLIARENFDMFLKPPLMSYKSSSDMIVLSTWYCATWYCAMSILHLFLPLSNSAFRKRVQNSAGESEIQQTKSTFSGAANNSLLMPIEKFHDWARLTCPVQVLCISRHLQLQLFGSLG
jgi:hypothetical protein